MLGWVLNDEDKDMWPNEIIMRLATWERTHLIFVGRFYDSSNDISNVSISRGRGTTKSCLCSHLHRNISLQDPSLAGKKYHRDFRRDRGICFCNSVQPMLLEVRLATNGRMQHAHTFSGHPNVQHALNLFTCMVVFDA